MSMDCKSLITEKYNFIFWGQNEIYETGLEALKYISLLHFLLKFFCFLLLIFFRVQMNTGMKSRFLMTLGTFLINSTGLQSVCDLRSKLEK